MMGYGAGLGFGFGGLFTMAGCLLLVVGLVLLAAWAFGRLGPRQPSQAVSTPASDLALLPDAVEVLRLRLARGEISVEEFATAKQALESGR